MSNTPTTEPDTQQRVDADQDLVAAAKAELPYRTRSYEALMRKYESLMFGVCYRTLNNRADAEDVLQDVMFKVYNTLGGFEGRSAFKTWLMRVTMNTCLTFISKSKRRREFREQWTQETADTTVTHLDTAGYDVEALLANIKPQDREVLTLRYLADLSLADIAESCGISLSAAKMRLYRATEALNQTVSDENS